MFRKQLKTQKGKSTLAIALASLAVLAILLIVFFGDHLPFVKQKSYQVLAPSPTGSQITEQTYSNNQYGIEFKYSPDWQVQDLSIKNEKTIFSVLQIAPTGFKGNLAPIKLLHIPNPKMLSLPELENSVATKNQSVPTIYSPADTYVLSGAGLPAYFRNEGVCATSKCQIYTFSKGDKVFQLVSFPEINIPRQNEVFAKVFNSIRLREASPTETESTRSSTTR